MMRDIPVKRIEEFVDIFAGIVRKTPGAEGGRVSVRVKLERERTGRRSFGGKAEANATPVGIVGGRASIGGGTESEVSVEGDYILEGIVFLGPHREDDEADGDARTPSVELEA